jgi:ornithine cyclodeaminase
VRSFSADAIEARARRWAPIVDAADASLAALARGSCQAPVRTSLHLSDGVLLTMPGRLDGSTRAAVKLVTVMPGNAERGLPTIQGIVVLFDANMGEPIATLEGAVLTAVRTAAISAAAARRLAPHRLRRLALLGAGAQAPWQARAIASVSELEGIHVWAPSNRNRERLARSLADELNVEVHPMSNLREALRGADVICCATTARAPIVHARDLPDNAVLVIAIGAFTPEMAEVAPDVFRKAGRVYVDDPAATMHEAGDVLAAIREGAIGESDVLPVGSASVGTASADAPVTIFKSVGSAAEDAAVAAAVAGD